MAPSRYLANESISVISGNSCLAYEDEEELDNFLSQGEDLPDEGGEGANG